VVYNLPDLNAELRLTGPVIADIYLNRITNWNDPRISELNPDVKLPNLPIDPVHRTDGSATTFVFTGYLCASSKDFQRLVGSGAQVEWLKGTGSKGGEGILGPVRSTKGAIGYIEYAHARQNDVPFAAVQNREGKWVMPSPKGASAAIEASLPAAEKAHGLTFSAWEAAGAQSYPITGISFVVIRRNLAYLNDKGKARAMIDFLKWSVSDAQRFAIDLDYGALGDAAQNKVLKALEAVSDERK
jgi:phosphate transport system substrate-binding protein